MAGIDAVAVSGRWWRQVPHGIDPLARPAVPKDGRWQRGHVVDAVYLADSEDTALAEWYRWLAEFGLPPERSLPVVVPTKRRQHRDARDCIACRRPPAGQHERRAMPTERLVAAPRAERLMASTATAIPAPQHMRALQYANEVRLARAQLKRKIASGEISAREVLVICPWHAASMSVSDLLMSQKWWGRTRCRRLLVSVGIPETKRVNALTARQRTALAAVLCLAVGGQA